jgi:hypothetical protein
MTAPLPTGQLPAVHVPAPAVLLEVERGDDTVGVELDCCLLERPRVVRLKEKDPPLVPQHVVTVWSLQHQLGLDAA